MGVHKTFVILREEELERKVAAALAVFYLETSRRPTSLKINYTETPLGAGGGTAIDISVVPNYEESK